jgi:hypothetical protein
MTWRLGRLLDLRRRRRDEAAATLAGAVARQRAAEAEARALDDRAAGTRDRALRAGVGGDAARWAARLRGEAAVLLLQAAQAEARARVEAAGLAGPQETLRRAALDQGVLERLEAAWLAARRQAAARRAEAAIDDRPWGRGGAAPR